MTHPYRHQPNRAFWNRSVASGWAPLDLLDGEFLIRRGEKVASAGSCFASNIVPYVEKAGFQYVRVRETSSAFGALAEDNFGYSKFSAAYGNIYTARQAVQLLKRALGRFSPIEDRWHIDGLVIDPFRPGLRHPASSDSEFDLLQSQHLAAVLEAVREADVFVFTLGLTEAWISADDGAVFPACPGTIRGIFAPDRHLFHNFTAREVSADLGEFIALLREIKPAVRIILTVSPVPLVATASGGHVLSATIYSKSVLRVAAQEAVDRHDDVTYFPAYEIVTGPQAPWSFFEDCRREPSREAIDLVMGTLLQRCEGVGEMAAPAAPVAVPNVTGELSRILAAADCEEAASAVV